MMLAGEPYVLDYLAHIEADVEAVRDPAQWTFQRVDLVAEHVTMWKFNRVDAENAPLD